MRAGVVPRWTVAPVLLNATLGRPWSSAARRALREFDALREPDRPRLLALFDAPWSPIYILVCFPVAHLDRPARAHRRRCSCRSSRGGPSGDATDVDRAQEVRVTDLRRAGRPRWQVRTHPALGIAPRDGTRQLRQRIHARAAERSRACAGEYFNRTKFARLSCSRCRSARRAVQSTTNSAGAIFAASFLIARSLAPIELLSALKAIAQARSGYFRTRSAAGGRAARRRTGPDCRHRARQHLRPKA